MPTGLKVFFTKTADQDFSDILSYIKRDFGASAAQNFKSLVLRFADIIEVFPEIGSLELHDKNIRGLVVHGRLKIFYRITPKRIIVLRLFDTRQNPETKF
ncbi:type II toxin-antitoxin system RelE/ParE family toxin [Mucilaginibacter terrenus]|uniref:Type II toxin-antitoxin system RelE/ParE family toxin n=1 Tax=Mucilaginibacter terrenus TaxID=2482727 RepID=A0A3E2NX63_9SPHI|nr:type II toxin-antitoxin system RelE/ParE family toxin [Mucilaginibacter terrenus]RFZ85614.1 type II toxin-antitoxin system RelE/ParE family toxin [Mucilaginibacter terrenus]